MVIIMGTRMARYKKKTKKRHKNRGKLKGITIIALLVIFVLVISKVDRELRISTSSQEERLIALSYSEDVLDIKLLGNKYYIDTDDIRYFFKNLKDTVKRLKDQSALVF